MIRRISNDQPISDETRSYIRRRVEQHFAEKASGRLDEARDQEVYFARQDLEDALRGHYRPALVALGRDALAHANERYFADEHDYGPEKADALSRDHALSHLRMQGITGSLADECIAAAEAEQ